MFTFNLVDSLLISFVVLGKVQFQKMADLKAVFAQFANSANEGEAACLDKKKVKRALKVNILPFIVGTQTYALFATPF